MFQSIKRARFISKYNSPHPVMGDLAGLHLWLQENGWPANEMVDALMKYKASSPGQEDYTWKLTFDIFMNKQFLFVYGQDPAALEYINKEWVNNSEFSRHMTPALKEFLRRQ